MADSQVSLEQQEQVLENNRDFIVKRLDADDVIDELIQAKLIGQNAAQRVELMGTSRLEKNRIIFDQLITCGPGALEKFCEILKRKKRQSFIAEQLEKCEYELQYIVHNVFVNIRLFAFCFLYLLIPHCILYRYPFNYYTSYYCEV